MKKNISDYQNIPTLLQTPHLLQRCQKHTLRKKSAYSNGVGKVGLFTQKEKKKRTKDLDLNCLSLYKKSTQNRSK